jgi:hypothetical protein
MAWDTLSFVDARFITYNKTPNIFDCQSPLSATARAPPFASRPLYNRAHPNATPRTTKRTLVALYPWGYAYPRRHPSPLPLRCCPTAARTPGPSPERPSPLSPLDVPSWGQGAWPSGAPCLTGVVTVCGVKGRDPLTRDHRPGLGSLGWDLGRTLYCAVPAPRPSCRPG